ncbi:hypothetical protein T190_04270 [Sinorhizobium meliloti CCBAU 01290]|nr:hypothetical protein T190_04270 [Sinorhizobium meliloti CCBAU 01290]
MVSPSGEGYLLESCQRAGAYFVNWLLDAFAGGRSDPAIFDRLESEASSLDVGSGGVTVCSYLMGCMDPHWDANARATFTGMGPETGIGHLYRASMEAITLEFVRSLLEMKSMGVAADRIFVIGGGAGSPLWRQMVADASGLPVIRSLSNEASALGAGMSAAVGAGWYGHFRRPPTPCRASPNRLNLALLPRKHGRPCPAGRRTSTAQSATSIMPITGPDPFVLTTFGREASQKRADLPDTLELSRRIAT